MMILALPRVAVFGARKVTEYINVNQFWPAMILPAEAQPHTGQRKGVR